MLKIGQKCVPVHFKVQIYLLNVKFQGNWNGFEKPKKIPKDGDVPKSEPCGVYFLTKPTQRFWEDPQTPVRPDQSQPKWKCPVILFYLRPWQSLRQVLTSFFFLFRMFMQYFWSEKSKNGRKLVICDESIAATVQEWPKLKEFWSEKSKNGRK